jgi:hypothetical protein
MAALGCALPIGVASASESLQRLGDALQYALPAAGLAAAGIHRDAAGAAQWFWSGATTLTVVGVGKAVGEKTRPDETSATSYPSGHAAWAFWGASFLDTRYGPAWGVPAYALAALTAYSRVEADKHYPDDVLAGASIALLSNFFWVRPAARDVTIAPMTTRDGVRGLALVVFDAPVRALDAGARPLDDPRWRFVYRVERARTLKNVAASPAHAASSGGEVDLAHLAAAADPTIVSSLVIARVDGARELSLHVAPFGTGAVAPLDRLVSFDGTAFGAGTTDVDYRFNDYRIRYRQAFGAAEAVTVRLGAALQAARTAVTLAQPQARASVSAWSVLPLLHASAEWRFARDWVLELDGEGMALGSRRFAEAGLRLQYRFSDGWHAAFGVTERRATIDADTLYNELRQRAPQLVLEHRW